MTTYYDFRNLAKDNLFQTFVDGDETMYISFCKNLPIWIVEEKGCPVGQKTMAIIVNSKDNTCKVIAEQAPVKKEDIT